MIIRIKVGQQIPADCILISTDQPIVVKETSNTGELDDFDKEALKDDNYLKNPCPFLVAQSYVMQGSGLALVCSVGKNCRF